MLLPQVQATFLKTKRVPSMESKMGNWRLVFEFTYTLQTFVEGILLENVRRLQANAI